MKVTRILLLSLTAVVLLDVVRLWPDAPPQMASHFDTAGRPNGFLPKDGFFLGFAAASLLVSYLFLALPHALRRGEEQGLAFSTEDLSASAERREWVSRRLVTYFAVYGLVCQLALLCALELASAANRSLTPRLAVDLVWVTVGLFVLFTFVWTLSYRASSRRTEH